MDLMSLHTERRKNQIVLIDDDECFLDIMSVLLKKFDIEVFRFDNVQEAMTHIHHNQDPKRLLAIVSDVRMPNLDGGDMLTIVRSEHEWDEVPFFFLSAVTQRDIMNQIDDLHFNGFIQKPLTEQKLREQLIYKVM